MHIQVLMVFNNILRKVSVKMSKVVFKSPYVSSGKAVGGGYINYMAKRERVDKSINTKKVEINLNYIATRPRVEKIGEHGLFGSKDDVNLNKARSDILSHNGIVWLPKERKIFILPVRTDGYWSLPIFLAKNMQSIFILIFAEVKDEKRLFN